MDKLNAINLETNQQRHLSVISFSPSRRHKSVKNCNYIFHLLKSVSLCDAIFILTRPTNRKIYFFYFISSDVERGKNEGKAISFSERLPEEIFQKKKRKFEAAKKRNSLRWFPFILCHSSEFFEENCRPRSDKKKTYGGQYGVTARLVEELLIDNCM